MKKVYSVLAILILICGNILLRNDFLPFMKWWFAIFYLGIIFMPLTSWIFDSFHDKGYLFSKAIGLAVSGYITWLMASLHIMKFTAINCIISMIICLIFNLLLIWLKKRYTKVSLRQSLRKMLAENFDIMLGEEVIFLALFLLFSYIRGFKPEAYGTEKFMDYGFMTSMLRSEYMPPQDFWYSGTSLNYYYMGQFLASFLTRLSFVKVSVGYNLMLMMVGAFACVLPYSIVYNVILQFMKDKGKISRYLPPACGFIAGVAVCIAGNMHYPSYKWFEPLVRKFFGMEKGTYSYWFPDATRFIGYHPETNDKTIHEFPCYSFVLGDLHAHVVNIMFVLTVVGILLAWMIWRRKKVGSGLSLAKEVLNPAIIMISFFIGFFKMTNYWDFPIYYVVSGAVILFTNIIVYNFKGKAIFVITAVQGAFVMAVSVLTSLPFMLSFDKIASNIRLAQSHTALNQLIILWGLPFFIVFSYIGFMLADVFKKKNINDGIVVNEHNRQGEHISFIRRIFSELTPSDLFIITLGLCAAGLVLLPELIYVEDIYSGDYKRANTMFKLTYQAFILFGICIGYILPRLMVYGNSWRRIRYSVAGLILFAMTVCYAQNAVNAWYGNILIPSGYKGLDATAFMYDVMPDDMDAINWLNENVTGMPVVLEANGSSYSDYQRVSVMTGLPTILGWRTHEWLWKSDESMVTEREDIVEKIYCSTDEGEVRRLLEEYEVAYIYVGKLEREKFPFINEELIQKLGDKVYSSLDEANYETYIIKVRN